MNSLLMSKTHLSILAAALVLSGCTMIPKYERPAAPVAAQYPRATESQKESAASDIAWQNFFAEERLKKLIELALANNRDFRVAILNVEQSRAQYRITRSASFPTVDGSGSYTRSSMPRAPRSGVTSGQGTASTGTGLSQQWSASLGTTAYEVDLFGRVRSLNRQALEKYLATDEAQTQCADFRRGRGRHSILHPASGGGATPSGAADIGKPCRTPMISTRPRLTPEPAMNWICARRKDRCKPRRSMC